MTFQVRRKNEVTKCNNLKIIKKSVTKPNIIEKQKTQGLKSMPMYREVGVSARKDEGYDRKKRHYIKNLWKFETNTRMKNHLVYIGKRTRHFVLFSKLKR